MLKSLKRWVKNFWTFISKTRLRLFIFFLFLGFLFWFFIRFEESNGLMSRKVFTIAKDDNWYPVNLMGKGRNVSAFSEDIIMEIAQLQGLRIQVISVSTNNLVPGLWNKNYDAILSAITPTGYNQETYYFSHPYFLIGPVVVVPKGSPIKVINDLKGKTIGLSSESNLIFDIQNYPFVYINTYDNSIRALDDLNEGILDAVIMDGLPAFLYTTGFYRESLEIVFGPLTQEGLRLMSLKNPAGEYLIENFNEGLRQLRESGRYDELIIKWGLVDLENPPEL